MLLNDLMPIGQYCPYGDASSLRSLPDVEAFARQCLAEWGLKNWSFAWDRAVRRLGCCYGGQRRITLSRYFAEYYLPKEPEKVQVTILHEVAHALAMENHRETGHGSMWRYYCAELGIPGEKATCRCEDFAPPHLRKADKTRYVLCHRETGEVYRRYSRRPRKSPAVLARTYIRGKKAETLGKLEIRELPQESV